MMKQILREESLKASLSEDYILISDKPGGCINIMLCQAILIRPCSPLQSWKLTFYISRIQHLMWKVKAKVAQFVSDSSLPHGLYSSWNSPNQNTGVGSLSLLQGIFPTQGLNPGLPTAGGFFTSWATREAQCAAPKCSAQWLGMDMMMSCLLYRNRRTTVSSLPSPSVETLDWGRNSPIPGCLSPS